MILIESTSNLMRTVCAGICFLGLVVTLIGCGSAGRRSDLHEKMLKGENLHDRRLDLHEKMLKGENLHDGSLELESIGDISSVPALMVVLKKHPPNEQGIMVCTSAHALAALRKITGANPGIRYEDWDAWWKKYKEGGE